MLHRTTHMPAICSATCAACPGGSCTSKPCFQLYSRTVPGLPTPPCTLKHNDQKLSFIYKNRMSRRTALQNFLLIKCEHSLVTDVEYIADRQLVVLDQFLSRSRAQHRLIEHDEQRRKEDHAIDKQERPAPYRQAVLPFQVIDGDNRRDQRRDDQKE